MSVARLLWSPELLTYDFGPGHPMAPARLDLTFRLADAFGLFDEPSLEVVRIPPSTDDLVRTVHDGDYVAAVRRADRTGEPDLVRGLGTEDNPVFAGMHEAASRLVSASVAAAEATWTGAAEHAVNIAGGMHHARRAAASGFCLYNDAAAAVQRLLDLGARRVAYVDLDAHHGDGVESIFWDDPRVLTVSVHQDGRSLFPGTGNPADTGGTAADCTAVNVALPPRTDSARWLRAVDAILPLVLREFRPDAIVSQHGTDAHGNDPMADLNVGIDAQLTAASWVHDLAHELCEGRWVALGGGGYAVVDVVPLVWTALVALAAHVPLAPATPLPEVWRTAAEEMSGLTPARALGKAPVVWRPWSEGYDPSDAVDRAVLATRRHVFPGLGLDPFLD
ncbi:acetoin utilization protein AcuC [Isoptericola sp. CG 20/1183]|uniref:Acetoin utilization protein AcuC n=1 Tax=Isoptericola halotolerans TaxID=300560 RepID=A0ABX5EIZ8_9MICO|nr:MULTISPECIES: acetoin utilization protein AcuC [Isoptericola]PRZ09661.1 acetoin utilization protein AcuC [Isoptericola sp. CG 20/1183]PRZ10462.1 acetoin utilization protein AcuC [Isoptericola halotolerans]